MRTTQAIRKLRAGSLLLIMAVVLVQCQEEQVESSTAGIAQTAFEQEQAQEGEQPSVPPSPTEPFLISTFEIDQVRVVPIATGLANPWGMAFRDNGDILITERYTGKLRVVRDGKLLDSDISGMPDWNEEQKMALRKAFNVQGSTFDNTSKFFGVKCDRSYFDNAMGVAVGWGGLQAKDAYYSPVQVEKNDGKTAYTITVPKDVPTDHFWSITVYDQGRYMVKNEQNRYAYNSVTAKKNEDGSTTIHFGGDPKADNYMPIPKDWLYLIRFYGPQEEILSGKWKMPAAVEVK
jgi:hypothetical protein